MNHYIKTYHSLNSIWLEGTTWDWRFSWQWKCWLWSSRLLCYVVLQVVTNVSEQYITSAFRTGAGGCMFLWNVGNHLQDYKASQPKRLQLTQTVLSVFSTSIPYFKNTDVVRVWWDSPVTADILQQYRLTGSNFTITCLYIWWNTYCNKWAAAPTSITTRAACITSRTNLMTSWANCVDWYLFYRLLSIVWCYLWWMYCIIYE
jgi:hypothetical protein